jgi:O-antigen/teichoic acid export membrane protein
MLSTLGLTVMTVVLLPYYKNKKLNRYEISTAFSSLLIIYSMFVAVIVLILGDEILLLIFGKKYLAAINLFKTSMLSLFLLGLGAIRTMYLISKKKTFLLFKIQIIIVSIIITLLTIFIPKYGLKGAVYVMIIGQFISSILINLVWKETRSLLKLQFNSLLFYTHINKLSKTI